MIIQFKTKFHSATFRICKCPYKYSKFSVVNSNDYSLNCVYFIELLTGVVDIIDVYIDDIKVCSLSKEYLNIIMELFDNTLVLCNRGLLVIIDEIITNNSINIDSLSLDKIVPLNHKSKYRELSNLGDNKNVENLFIPIKLIYDNSSYEVFQDYVYYHTNIYDKSDKMVLIIDDRIIHCDYVCFSKSGDISVINPEKIISLIENMQHVVKIPHMSYEICTNFENIYHDYMYNTYYLKRRDNNVEKVR